MVSEVGHSPIVAPSYSLTIGFAIVSRSNCGATHPSILIIVFDKFGSRVHVLPSSLCEAIAVQRCNLPTLATLMGKSWGDASAELHADLQYVFNLISFGFSCRCRRCSAHSFHSSRRSTTSMFGGVYHQDSGAEAV